MNKPSFIPVAAPVIGQRELHYLTAAIEAGEISSLGRYVGQFENAFARYCGTRHGVATMNGTVALHLALKALGIGPGDEVIVPALTFVASANAVAYCGATPVFVDVHPRNWNIDPSLIEASLTERTKAIITVDLYGHPADADPILELAKRRGLVVVEDAAEAHGAEYHGRRAGSLGTVGVFSFYGNKTITTGEGGMLVTDDERLVERARFLKDHAMDTKRRYWHPEIGFNYRMTNLQAAIGLAQLEQIDIFIARKREIARRYNDRLAGLPGIHLPPEEPWAKNTYWMYSILVDEAEGRINRETLIAKLRKQEIDSRPFFYVIPHMPPYAGHDRRFPVAEKLSRTGLNLPSSVKLTDDELDRVAQVIVSEVS